MENIYATTSVSITELKKNPSAILEEAGDLVVAILNHNKPAAYLVPAQTYEAFLEKLEDLDFAKIVKQRAHEPRIKVTLDDF